jgi:sporulation protein YlmC with PRC-barrel domain
MDKIDMSETNTLRDRDVMDIDAMDIDAMNDVTHDPLDLDSDYDYDEHVSVLSAGTLIGTPVTNLDGEDLGHIEEIMLDLATGNVAYVVVSFGGLLGVGNKLFAIPWQSLHIDQDEETAVMDVDRATLENAPGFDRNNWPQTVEPSWLGEVYTYYGYTYPLI